MPLGILRFVRKELLEFTGLPPEQLDLYLERRCYPAHRAEWRFWHPEGAEDIRWFYAASRAYLFANARHVLPPAIKERISPGSRVIDFGGGSGNYSFELAQKGCNVQYFEINLLQREFVKRVARKHSLPIQIARVDSEWLPQFTEQADALLALDVFEHIPDYRPYVRRLAYAAKPGAMLYVHAPFASGEPAHLEDSHNLPGVLADNGFVASEGHFRYEDRKDTAR